MTRALEQKHRIVIIPLFNEVETIREVLAELCRWHDGDVLLVDDGSTDGSVSQIRGCIEHRPIHLLTHERNQGYGASLIDGFRYAANHGYTQAVTMDCDWQHQPRHVPEFFSALDDADVVSGSRYLKELPENTEAPSDRRSLNVEITERLNTITGFNLTDAFCGFKGYRVSALTKMFLSETGYAFPIQFWIEAWKHKLTVLEIPVARIYTGAKRSFGPVLDDSLVRKAYYQSVIERELTR